MNIIDKRLIKESGNLIVNKKLPVTRMVILVSVISILWIFLYKFWFLNINAIFLGAFITGEIFYTIALSIIS